MPTASASDEAGQGRQQRRCPTRQRRTLSSATARPTRRGSARSCRQRLTSRLDWGRRSEMPAAAVGVCRRPRDPPRRTGNILQTERDNPDGQQRFRRPNSARTDAKYPIGRRSALFEAANGVVADLLAGRGYGRAAISSGNQHERNIRVISLDILLQVTVADSYSGTTAK
jgi:hypothetical protein